MVLSTFAPCDKSLVEAGDKSPAWKFSDWSGTLTQMGTVLAIILPFVQQNPLITGLSLIFGVVVLLAPMIYTAAFPATYSRWLFRVCSMLTLWAVLVELWAAYKACDDLSRQVLPFPLSPSVLPIFSSMITLFRFLLVVSILVVICYTLNTTCDRNVIWERLTEACRKGWNLALRPVMRHSVR